MKETEENYRLVSLLNIDSKILEKYIVQSFSRVPKSPHGFVRRISVCTNMMLFLKRIHEVLDHDPHSEIIAFYTDF